MIKQAHTHTHTHTHTLQSRTLKWKEFQSFTSMSAWCSSVILTYSRSLLSSLSSHQPQLRLSLLCTAPCMLQVKTSALKLFIIKPDFSQTSDLVLDNMLPTSWCSQLANFAVISSILMQPARGYISVRSVMKLMTKSRTIICQ